MNEAQALDFMRDAIPDVASGHRTCNACRPHRRADHFVVPGVDLNSGNDHLRSEDIDCLFSLIVFLPFMLATMRTFMEGVADKIIGLGSG